MSRNNQRRGAQEDAYEEPAAIQQFMTLHEAQEQPVSAPLFVVNSTSHNERVGQMSQMVVVVNPTNGDPIQVLIRDTWLPDDLTLQASRQDILSSAHFRNALAQKVLRLVTPEYAESLNRDPLAAVERQRLSRAQAMVDEATTARPMAGSVTSAADVDSTRGTEAVRNRNRANPIGGKGTLTMANGSGSYHEGGDEPSAESDNVTVQFKAFVDRALDQGDDQLILNTLMGRGKMRNIDEVLYLQDRFARTPYRECQSVINSTLAAMRRKQALGEY